MTASEMVELYDRHMARRQSRGREIYDSIMIAAESDMCPFCGHRLVSTLDHCLPKSKHPGLAVTPINLIPSCKDCNHEKSNREPTGEEDLFLNAYYDDVTRERWLFCQIVESEPAAARFFVNAPASWDAVLKTRVKNHFEKLGLAKLYGSQGGRQLQNMRRALSEIYAAAGTGAVRKDLQRQFRSCTEVRLNSWEGALYEAAAASDWYCGGGFSVTT